MVQSCAGERACGARAYVGRAANGGGRGAADGLGAAAPCPCAVRAHRAQVCVRCACAAVSLCLCAMTDATTDPTCRSRVLRCHMSDSQRTWATRWGEGRRAFAYPCEQRGADCVHAARAVLEGELTPRHRGHGRVVEDGLVPATARRAAGASGGAWVDVDDWYVQERARFVFSFARAERTPRSPFCLRATIVFFCVKNPVVIAI